MSHISWMTKMVLNVAYFLDNRVGLSWDEGHRQFVILKGALAAIQELGLWRCY